MTSVQAGGQTIEVPLEVGSRVTLLKDDAVVFMGTVEQYVPDTGLLKFKGRDIGRAEFCNLVEDADGIEIYRE